MRATLVLLALLAAPRAHAADTYSYVVRLGRDTLSLETVTRTPTEVRGELIARTPRNVYRSYVMALAPDGTVRTFYLTTRPMGSRAGVGEARSRIEFQGDSATVTVPRGDSSVTARVAAGAGAVPYLGGVMGTMDQVAWQARGALGDSVRVALVPPGGAPLGGTVVATATDSVQIVVDTPVGRIPPFQLARDEQRRLVSFSGHGSVFQAEAERIPAPDLAAKALEFVDRPIGTLSRRDTVRAKVGDAELWLDYGRPEKRGRVLFGDVVPWGIVWRTGANAATQFRTSQPLAFGEQKLPAGLYSLWTFPTRTCWTLIVNQQNGQWGTQYNADRDVLRAKMTVARLPESVEQLTLKIEANGSDGWLILDWDHTRAMVPFRAVK